MVDASLPWESLLSHYANEVKPHHLRELLQDSSRNAVLKAEFDGIALDFSHIKMTEKTLQLLVELVDKTALFAKVEALFHGEKINISENRSVLHVALRSAPEDNYPSDGKNVVPEVHAVLSQISSFSAAVRANTLKGFTGKNLSNVVVIGIGGSYLGIEFVYEALRCHTDARKLSEGRRLRFLANVDPIDFNRAIEGLCPEETLFVVNSKTFTTAETILNAKTCKDWVLKHYEKLGHKPEEFNQIVNAHFSACSTNLEETSKFGIQDKERVFAFWDWVGGRFSVSSCIGILSLSLHFGFEFMQLFLKGMRSIDQHFLHTRKVTENLPLLLGLIGFYNTTIQNFSARAILPYCQALSKFAPHIQQLDMESNGKRVTKDGQELKYETGALNFGEPGTNGQHSFYQLLHQGRSIPCEFIGFCRSQTPTNISGEPVTNHDELMSNFFSQPDALACGKTLEELKKEGVKESLWNHKLFPGDRSSLSFLFEELNPYTCGQLLAIYEHRTSVEGFLWGVNSYDQMGVELGKALAKNVRKLFQETKEKKEADFAGYSFNSATKSLLERYIKLK